MRVLFFSDLWLPFPGGAERYIFNMAKELHDRGHEISILTSYEKAIAGHQDFELVQELDLGKRDNREDRFEMLRQHVEHLHPDVIFVHRYFAEEYGEYLPSLNRPIVEVIHQHKKLVNVKLQIFNTEYTRRANGVEPGFNNMVIIPPAYNAPQTPPGDYIGFVKPLEGKGIMFLYDLADRMPERKFLVLRGEWQSCETIIEKPNVTFINPVDDMDQFYNQVRITLMPSLSEDAGTIPQESAAHGRPCISSNVMGLPETNIGGIILPHDLNSWVDAIRQLDMENYYKEVVHREQEGLVGFAWEEKFDDLSRRINP